MVMSGYMKFVVLVVSSFVELYFYVKSVGPAALEKRIGEIAYKRCARYRIIGSIFMFVTMGNFVLYVFHPLPIDLPRTFPWSSWVSFLLGMVIGVPSGYLMWLGIRDAG
jgi:hypothetical protein